MSRKVLAKVFVCAALASVMVWVGSAAAFESYHDPALDDQGYCSECHPGFTGGRSDALHALHTANPDAVTTNCDLCHAPDGRDNPFTMWSELNNDTGLGCAGCHGRDYGETVEADYRGLPSEGECYSQLKFGW
jgi:hypothetical protein